ncbi:MAG: orotidine-5'-phosphate decarboxylase [Alphaproteobacteria bacterium]
MTNPIYVAVDKPNLDAAISLCQQIKAYVGGIKLGKEFIAGCGPEGIRTIAELGLPIFADVKFHDIPNTVASAILALAPLRPAIINVHTAGGSKMMQAAAAACQQIEKQYHYRPLIIGVTILTSLSQEEIEEVGYQLPIAEQTLLLAKLAQSSGLDGVVCSSHEIKAIKEACGQDFKTIVPGIRPSWAAAGDQTRIMTPKQALAEGADYLVIGRPITQADNPAQACQDILNEL